jgi:hypothetical protein
MTVRSEAVRQGQGARGGPFGRFGQGKGEPGVTFAWRDITVGKKHPIAMVKAVGLVGLRNAERVASHGRRFYVAVSLGRRTQSQDRETGWNYQSATSV